MSPEILGQVVRISRQRHSGRSPSQELHSTALQCSTLCVRLSPQLSPLGPGGETCGVIYCNSAYHILFPSQFGPLRCPVFRHWKQTLFSLTTSHLLSTLSLRNSLQFGRKWLVFSQSKHNGFWPDFARGVGFSSSSSWIAKV